MSVRFLVLIAAVLIGGCSAFDGVFTRPSSSADDQPVTLGVPQAPLDNNRFVLQDGEDAVGQLQVVRAKNEDTFVDFARTYGLGFDELIAANPGIDPWLPGNGVAILLPTRFLLPDVAREGIVLNIAAKRLFYFPSVDEGDPRIVETYPIGIGREGWETPIGDTKIISKARDPVWFVPASVRKEHAELGDPLPRQVPPGPDNPLGHYVLGLGIPGYLIHGTNKPAGVGMRVSHGCVRLFPEHIESLYSRVGKNVRVQIVNQPYLIGWQGDDFLMEAHPPLVEDERDWAEELPNMVKAVFEQRPNGRAVLAQENIDAIAADQLGVPVSISSRKNATQATIRSARHVENIVVFDKLADYSAD